MTTPPTMTATQQITTPHDSLSAVRKEGFAVEKSNIEINEPIKCQGEYLVKLKLDNNLEGKIKIII